MFTLIDFIGVVVRLFIVGVVFLKVCACVFSPRMISPVDKAARAEYPEMRSVFLRFVMIKKFVE